ncbi:hypothetical protein TNCV_1976601 [Trichonephila clavipes]|nr:hypothetical protein TNCV_1976601 [Trichonephila clavipes]
MENTTFAMPSIIDSHDMGLRTVLQSRCPKRNAYSTKIHRDKPWTRSSKSHDDQRIAIHHRDATASQLFRELYAATGASVSLKGDYFQKTS